jgi:hypothetical protein
MPSLAEMFAAAVLVVMILAIIAPATGYLPSHTGQQGGRATKSRRPAPGHQRAEWEASR